MESSIQEWKNFLANDKSFSEHTISAYIIDLRYFLDFISAHHARANSLTLLDSLSIQDFRAWLSYRKRKNFAFSSTNRAIASVKNFFKYMIKNNQLSNKAIFTLKSPKQAVFDLIPARLMASCKPSTISEGF